MSTKRQKHKRVTKQVRVSTEWHKVLKIEAARSGLTIAKFLETTLGKLISAFPDAPTDRNRHIYLENSPSPDSRTGPEIGSSPSRSRPENYAEDTYRIRDVIIDTLPGQKTSVHEEVSQSLGKEISQTNGNFVSENSPAGDSIINRSAHNVSNHNEAKN